MTHRESLRILRLEAIHFYVGNLERTARLLSEQLDFAEVGRSNPESEAKSQQRSLVFEAGETRMLVSTPLGPNSRAARWLRKHPDGVGSVIFEVEDISHTFDLLDRRGGTPITDITAWEGDQGTFRTFAITTPLANTHFRFVERHNYRGLYPGIESHHQARGGKNAFRFGRIDHITCNFETMAPALLWMEHVLGFERFWDVAFHTDDVVREQEAKGASPYVKHGSGLRSVVMWDPRSGVKLANNEALRPHFRASQIHIFCEDQGGPGVQHAALTTENIIAAVRGMRARGVEFMPTPGAYYDALPERLNRIGVGAIEEAPDVLRELEILVDGNSRQKYMLQIFSKEFASLFGDPKGGPFFFEFIERKGDQGFGAGNFRALFESIEREQQAQGRVEGAA
ncbi:MAG: VOC family protein [Sandaracinaceae bacterium]|nr:VOC family protein [Sandaracinaceae bacterium]